MAHYRYDRASPARFAQVGRVDPGQARPDGVPFGLDDRCRRG